MRSAPMGALPGAPGCFSAMACATASRSGAVGDESPKEVSPAVVAARAALKALVHPTKFVVAVYIVDMGNVVMGLKRTRQFVLTNNGRASASFSIDPSQLHGSGFEVEPMKVQRLGECESITFDVTFAAEYLKGTPDGVGATRVDLLVRDDPGARRPVEILKHHVDAADDLWPMVPESDIPQVTVDVTHGQGAGL